MSKNYSELRGEIRECSRELHTLQPATLNAFYALSKAALVEGALSEKVKEYIALAIGISKHCDGCIAFHVKNLQNLGATREELGEVLGLCVYMGGGPSLMLAAEALQAWDQAA